MKSTHVADERNASYNRWNANVVSPSTAAALADDLIKRSNVALVKRKHLLALLMC